MEQVKLYEHQIAGIEFLVKHGRAILADEMGLGKTAQAILAAQAVADSNVLVVCPASIKINWQREIATFRPQDDTKVISGRKAQPGAFLSAREGVKTWFIINYDILAAHQAAIVAEPSIQVAILDESHYIKGRSIRASATMEVAKKIPNVFCLTGTPIMNRPIELFNQLRAIGHPIASNRTVFARRYCGAFFMQQMVNNFTGRKVLMPQNIAYQLNPATWRMTHIRFLNESGATNLDELRERVKDCILRRTKKEVLNLPEKTISTMEVEISPAQRREYDSAWERYVERLRAENTDEEKLKNVLAAQELVELTKLKQVCSQSKVDRIVEDILNAIDQEEKVIVFSQYHETINQISGRLRDKKIGTVVLTGQTKQTDRQKAVDRFQTEADVKVFVANIKAGGVGITLTEASIVIFADMEWSPELHSQAEDRAHRIGQAGTVNVYYYVCVETIEEDIAELLKKKKAIVAEVIDGTKKRVQTGGMMADFTKKMAKKIAGDN